MPLSLQRLSQNPDFVARGALSRPVHARQWYEKPGRPDGKPEVWGYGQGLSYAPGETFRLHAIASGGRLDLEIHRDGLDLVPVLAERGIAAPWRETPEDCSAVGCGWPAVWSFAVPEDWPSGGYRITLRNGEASSHHLFLVRAAAGPKRGRKKGRLLLVTADGTWAAYNDWGGSNAYEGLLDPDGNLFSPQLSNQRPLARGFTCLPDAASRATLDAPPAFGAAVSYPHLEWAWHGGYSKKYASAGWASYERHFLRWAEAAGYGVDLASQQDLHYRPEVLEGYGCLAFVGHDEYWTWEMRDAVDSYIEEGGRILRLAGNFLWQTRLEDAGRRQICYKYLARDRDPLYGGPQAWRTTNCWESPEVGRPGALTFGLNATRGMYAGWAGCAPRGSGGFTLYRPEHWAFDGSGLGYGDVLGSDARIFGYEVDGLAYRIEQGLPQATGEDGAAEDTRILALGLAGYIERASEAGEPLFLMDEDARYFAKILHGAATAESLAKVDRGSGMVVHFRKGQGEVFHAGTCDWVMGLKRRDGAVMRVTRNVLDRFLA